MENILSVKQRFGIIGDNPKLNRAIEKSIQVANSDISVLVTGRVVLERKIFQKLYISIHIENIQNILP